MDEDKFQNILKPSGQVEENEISVDGNFHIKTIEGTSLIAQLDDRTRYRGQLGVISSAKIFLRELIQQKRMVSKEKKQFEVFDSSNPFVVLALTSNMLSCGLRELIAALICERIFDVVIVTAGGIEEDIIKSISSTKMFISSFNCDGTKLREKGWNRIGNIIIPNDAYVSFESWFSKNYPEAKHAAGYGCGFHKVLHILGNRLGDSNSIVSSCSEQNVPIFCPSYSDGALGDNFVMAHYSNWTPNDSINGLEDVKEYKRLTDQAFKASRPQYLIQFGAGASKRFAEINRNFTKSLIVQTSTIGDGSNTSRICDTQTNYTIWGDCTLLVPLLFAGLCLGEADNLENNSSL